MRPTGNAGDRGAWKAEVVHGSLSSLPAPITGGSFEMATMSTGLTTDFVVGAFTGGTISSIDPGANCTDQTFAVSGALGSVATGTSTGGSGDFDVVLTHYRVRLFNRCITYAATVAGSASFTY